MAQRLVGHDGPEVRAADADVDDVPDAPARESLPVAVADPVAKRAHLVEHLVDAGDDVLAVHENRFVPGGAERDVEDGAVFGDVDLLAAEHRVDAFTQAAILGELEQEGERLVGDAVLRVIEVQARCLGRETLTALRVVGKQVAQVPPLHLLMVGGEGLPGGPLGERGVVHRPLLRLER